MSGLVFVLGIALVWLLIGLASGVVMARRGHDFRTWFGLGAISGPLVVRLIADAEPAAPHAARQMKKGFAGTGPVDALIGIDGSPESFRAVADVARLLGPRLGRVTIATVMDMEAEREFSPDDDRNRAEADLRAATDYLASIDITPTTELLSGRPAHVLEQHAVENEFDLIAVGARGTGLSIRVLGSVAEHLVRGNRRPVLVASAAS
jgi:nucleotide-binding universal stress UspA family protein